MNAHIRSYDGVRVHEHRFLHPLQNKYELGHRKKNVWKCIQWKLASSNTSLELDFQAEYRRYKQFTLYEYFKTEGTDERNTFPKAHNYK